MQGKNQITKETSGCTLGLIKGDIYKALHPSYFLIIMKLLNFAVSDATAKDLERIKEKLNIANNSDAMKILVENVYAQLFGEGAK